MMYILGVLLIIGLILGAVKMLPWIDDGIKRLIYIVVILVVGLWLIGRIFGVSIHSLP